MGQDFETDISGTLENSVVIGATDRIGIDAAASYLSAVASYRKPLGSMTLDQILAALELTDHDARRPPRSDHEYTHA